MIIYFAGSGRPVESRPFLQNLPADHWGILMSYVDLKNNKGNVGDKRFRYIANAKRVYKEKSKEDLPNAGGQTEIDGSLGDSSAGTSY